MISNITLTVLIRQQQSFVAGILFQTCPYSNISLHALKTTHQKNVTNTVHPKHHTRLPQLSKMQPQIDQRLQPASPAHLWRFSCCLGSHHLWQESVRSRIFFCRSSHLCWQVNGVLFIVIDKGSTPLAELIDNEFKFTL